MKFIALAAVVLALLPAMAGQSIFDYLWYSADEREVIRLMRRFDDLIGAPGLAATAAGPLVDDPPLVMPQTPADWQRLVHRREAQRKEPGREAGFVIRINQC
jgi:hypothetical protein